MLGEDARSTKKSELEALDPDISAILLTSQRIVLIRILKSWFEVRGIFLLLADLYRRMSLFC
jgi:hypothetical protein